MTTVVSSNGVVDDGVVPSGVVPSGVVPSGVVVDSVGRVVSHSTVFFLMLEFSSQ